MTDVGVTLTSHFVFKQLGTPVAFCIHFCLRNICSESTLYRECPHRDEQTMALDLQKVYKLVGHNNKSHNNTYTAVQTYFLDAPLHFPEHALA